MFFPIKMVSTKNWLNQLVTQIVHGLFLEIIIVLQYEAGVLEDCFPLCHTDFSKNVCCQDQHLIKQ